jgi:serine protein kinase
MNIFDHYRQRYEAAKDEEFTLQEFLTICRQDRSAYANAAERLLMAIGEPNMVDTALEPRLSRLFSNRVVARYPAFEEFYGMEDAIEQIVSYLKHAAQGLEEKKQILYLLGPVGGGKSSLAERLKSLMQRVPIYVLSANGERSPVNDHPLCLFNPQEDAQILDKEYGIPRRYLGTIMSPWAAKRLHEFGGDITKFRVVKVWPSILEQIAIAKTEPVMRTTRISRRWSVKSISVSWKTSRKTTRMPTVTPARCAGRTRGLWNSSRCLKHRLKCCIRC